MKKNLLLLKDFLELQRTIYKNMTALSKNAYTDKLDDVINEYNNTYHRAIKMKTIEVKILHILTLLKKLMIKTLNVKLVIKIQKHFY